MTGPVVILVPVLERPHRVRPLLDSIVAATPEPHSVLFIADRGDTRERDELARAGAQILLHSGTYAQKINAGVRATDEPLIFLGADDLHFHDGWLPAAAVLLDDTVGVVGTNDLGNSRVVAGKHATHSLVARWYAERGTIDEPGKVLHEGYRHNYCDTEFVGTAQARGAFAFAAGSVVEHLHPNWGKAETDATYQRGQATFRIDSRTFTRRRRLWT